MRDLNNLFLGSDPMEYTQSLSLSPGIREVLWLESLIPGEMNDLEKCKPNSGSKVHLFVLRKSL